MLTAIDWARNVYGDTNARGPNGIIQVIRSDNPRTDPYSYHNGVEILECLNIISFFQELEAHFDRKSQEHDAMEKRVQEISDYLKNADKDKVDYFIDNQEKRKEVLKTLSGYSEKIIDGFITFFSKCIDKVWERARPDGAFYAYNEGLNLIIDFLTCIEFQKMPTILFLKLCDSLNSLSSYIGEEHGKGWQASRTWSARKSEIPPEIIDEIRNYANTTGMINLFGLLNR